MIIKTKKSKTIISGLIFIVLGILFIDLNRMVSYIFFGTGMLIEAKGVIDEIRGEITG